MKYRIAIQSIHNGKYKHEHNIMLETNNIDKTIDKIRESIKEEIKEREELLQDWIEERTPNMIQKMIRETPEDLIDYNSKGYDITKEEYVKNEIEEDYKR